MPSKSPAQKRLMLAVAHGWKKPGGGGPSVKVAQDFVRADEDEGAVTPRHGLMKPTGKPRVGSRPKGRIERGEDNGADTMSRPVQVGKFPGYSGPGHDHIRAHRRKVGR